MHLPIRILYVGELMVGGTCLQRLQCFRELGHDTIQIDTRYEYGSCNANRMWHRIRWRLKLPADPAAANARIVSECQRNEFDIIWLDKAVTIKPSTLAVIRRLQPRAVMVGFSLDDMAARHNQSVYFLRGLVHYDVYITTKSYNVSELKELGATTVLFVANSYDLHTHRPRALSAEETNRFGSKVGFIGSYERARAKSLKYLADHGVRARILGSDWPKSEMRSPIKSPGPSVFGDSYAVAICATDVNLCFLRKCNRDLQTTRSVEIPACGAFMLAERTNEHLELFIEGREAEFFSSDDEMLRKIRFYLTHPEERRRIAASGRQRCVQSGYSYHERLAGLLKIIVPIKSEKETPS